MLIEKQAGTVDLIDKAASSPGARWAGSTADHSQRTSQISGVNALLTKE
jgi:hypothetical protein